MDWARRAGGAAGGHRAIPISKRRGEIARGSAAEAVAVMMIADLPGAPEQAEKLRRVDRMLERLGG